ncbi:MAG: hypothetical protein Q9190_000562 [Brigantiaea leucoxantha]
MPQTPPSKRDLTSWWKTFKKNTKKEDEKESLESPTGIFGVPLQESIKYANVAISLTNERGESYIYGYVPIVVAKCGVFLKEKATDIEGIFRLNGSAKRIKELQIAFDSPDRYGKGLDWTGFTVHDAANILRRYLNNLPQPIVPLEFYEKFRDPLRSHQAQAIGDMESRAQDDASDFDHGQAIITYQRLITELPPLNRQLLLYILDLLAVFSSKSDLNRMTSANLAAIFQPGLLRHPTHDMEPKEYRLSQDVLIFLIENQDSFLVGMSGTAADEKTVKEVQSGSQQRRPNSPRTPQSALGRSSSNASAGADSLRKFGGIRRNVSVSSKHSKNSTNVPSPAGSVPGSPHTTGSGVYRSNTVPSKKSPGIPSRLSRPMDVPTPINAAGPPSGYLSPNVRASSPASKSGAAHDGRSSAASSITPTTENPVGLAIANQDNKENQSRENLPQADSLTLQPPAPNFAKSESSGSPSRERKLSGLFAKLPTSDSERKEAKQPNKLRKKRLPESSNPSAQSSTNSLHAAPESPAEQSFYTPMPTPGVNGHAQVDPMANVTYQPPPLFSETSATPTTEVPPQPPQSPHQGQTERKLSSQLQSPNLKPVRSPTPSLHSRTSVTDVTSQSEAEQADDTVTKEKKKEKKHHRWRFSSSSSSKRNGDHPTVIANLSDISSNPIAENSTGSFIHQVTPGTSATSTALETYETTSRSGTEPLMPINTPNPSVETTPPKEKEGSKDRDLGQEPAEKKGPIGWFKEKVAKAKEERKEREAEKERAKSPPRIEGEARSGSKQSLSAIANDSVGRRGRSLDTKREDVGSNEGRATASTVSGS